MFKKSLHIFSNHLCKQTALLQNAAELYEIDAYVHYLTDPPEITIDEEIIINGNIIKDTVFMIHDIKPDYLAIPEMGSSNDYTLFQDHHISKEQNLSLFLSLFKIANSREDILVINESVLSFSSISTFAKLLQIDEAGLKMPEHVICNNFDDLKSSDLFSRSEYFLWTYPFSNSPLKIISRRKIIDLFKDKNNIPFLIMEAEQGRAVKLFFIKNKPVIGLIIDPPQYDSGNAEYERFQLIKPDNRFEELANFLDEIEISGFYSVNCILNDEGDLFITSYDIDPNITSFNDEINSFLAGSLVAELFEITSSELEFPKNKKRDGVFLERMTEPLFAIDKVNSGI